MPHYRQTIGGRYYKDLKNGNSVRVSEEEYNKNVRRVRGGFKLGQAILKNGNPVLTIDNDQLYSLNNNDGNPVYGENNGLPLYTINDGAGNPKINLATGKPFIATPKLAAAAAATSSSSSSSSSSSNGEGGAAIGAGAGGEGSASSTGTSPINAAKNKAIKNIDFIISGTRSPLNTAAYKNKVAT